MIDRGDNGGCGLPPVSVIKVTTLLSSPTNMLKLSPSVDTPTTLPLYTVPGINLSSIYMEVLVVFNISGDRDGLIMIRYSVNGGVPRFNGSSQVNITDVSATLVAVTFLGGPGGTIIYYIII